jgi:hypothetical protein
MMDSIIIIIIINGYFGEVLWGGEDWISLTQDRDKWRTLVKAVLNLRVP